MVNDPEAYYQRLGHLVATMPNDLDAGGWVRPDARLWLGRVTAAVREGGHSLDMATVSVAIDSLGSVTHSLSVQQIISVLYRTLAVAEQAAPATAQGSFLAAGEPYSARNAVAKVLSGATSSAMIIDPYADGNLLSDFAVLAPTGVQIMVLADKASHKPGLKPLAEAWVQQYGPSRPLQVRLSPAKALHDRIIIVDNKDAWTLGQSFNALAQRSPTSIMRADPQTAQLKADAYGQVWAAAEVMV